MNEPKHKRVQSSLVTQNLRIARLHKALTQNKANRQEEEGLADTEEHCDSRAVRRATGTVQCTAQVRNYMLGIPSTKRGA